MGEYLSKPDKTKHSSEGENSWVSHQIANSSTNIKLELQYDYVPEGLVVGDIKLVSGEPISCSSISFEQGSESTVSPVVNINGCSGDGEISFSVTAGKSIDLAGNPDQGTISQGIVIDNTVPNPPSNLLISSTYTSDELGSEVTYAPSSSADVSHYLIRLEDNSDWFQTTSLRYKSPIPLTPCLGYRFKVKAVDHLGQESVEAVSDAFKFINIVGNNNR